MEELYEKLNNLKESLTASNAVATIKKLNQELAKNEELLNLIAEYNTAPSEDLKGKISSNEFYQEYQFHEAELNFLILEINNELKKITKKDKCGL